MAARASAASAASLKSSTAVLQIILENPPYNGPLLSPKITIERSLRFRGKRPRGPTCSDQVQPRGIPVQSWAIVLAAIISSCGVIAAAFVQTGSILKSSQATAVARSPPRISEASFTGDIEPVCTCRDCMVRLASAETDDHPSAVHASTLREFFQESPKPIPLPPVNSQ